MFGKPIRLLVILAAAVGVPYVWFNKPLAKDVKSKVTSWFQKQRKSDDWLLLDVSGDGSEQAVAEDGTPVARPVVPRLSGPPANDLHEVLRFDITPRWVTERWSRISTIRGEPGLEGLRVPLVTGTSPDDLAGSMTYYFDRNRQLQRITFHGHTGDERKLVSVLASQFDMRPDAGLGVGVYLSRWNGQPTCVMRVVHSPVVRASAPHARFEVMFELNRPGVEFRLSPHSQAILDMDTSIPRR